MTVTLRLLGCEVLALTWGKDGQDESAGDALSAPVAVGFGQMWMDETNVGDERERR